MRLLRRLSIYFAALMAVSISSVASASTSGVTYQGRILKPDGSPLAGQFTQFKMQIRTPDSGACLMYEEVQSQDLRNSNGVFSLTINDGNGSRTDGTGLTLDRIFANRGTFTLSAATCNAGAGIFSPGTNDGRSLVVLFKDETMGTWEPIPAQKINFVPYAFESKMLSGFTSDSLLRVVDGLGDPLTGIAPLSNAQYTALLALANGSSTAYTKANELRGTAVPTMNAGEVLGWNGSAWVSTTSTPGALSVTTGMLQGGAVTGAKLDPAISISTSGTVAAAITTTRDFKIYAASPSTFYVGMLANPALAASYTLTWPLSAGASGQVLTTDGAGALTWTSTSAAGITALTGDVTATGPGSVVSTVASVGTSTAANIHSSELLANAATNANTASTIVKRDASGNFAAGAISAGSVVATGSVTGAALTATGAVTQGSSIYKDSGSNTVTVQAPTTVTSSYVLKWPVAGGSASQVLTTDASGNLSWTTMTGAPTGAAGGDLSGTYPNPTVATVGTSTAAQVHTAELLANAATSGPIVNAIVRRDGLGGFVATTGLFNTLALANSGSTITLNGPAGASYGLTLPTGMGTNGQVLATNGSGLTSWISPSGGSQWTTQAPGINYTGGLVGIGTTSAVTQLDIVANYTGAVMRLQNKDTTGYGSFDIYDAAGTKQAGYGWGNSATAANFANLFYQGTNNASPMTLRTNNIERLRIDSSGNVGIGTTNPSMGALDVRKNNGGIAGFFAPDASTPGVALTGAANGAKINAYNSAGVDAKLIVDSNGQGVMFGSSNSPQSRVDISGGVAIGSYAGNNAAPSNGLIVSGNVGIGTTSPNAKFDVKGSIVMSGATSGYAGFQPSAVAGSTVWTLPATDGTSGQVLSTNGSGILSWAAATGSSQWTTQAPGINYTSGNVGIGTTSATSLLTVVKNQAATTAIQIKNSNTTGDSLFQSFNDNGLIGEIGTTGSGGYAEWANFFNIYAYSASSGINIATQNASPITFRTSDTINRMQITGAGNVGIGTTSPNGLLDVKGSIVMSGATNGYAGFRPASSAGSTIWTLPAADGSSGQLLSTDGAGILSWTSAAGTGDFKANGTVTMTGALKIADGTAAAPSFTYGSDPDTGIYHSASDRVTFASGGSKSFEILGSSNSYITGGKGRFAIGTAANPTFGFENDTSTGLYGGSGTLGFTVGGTARQHITAAGDVGIGTTAPNAKLDVKGSIVMSGATSGYTGFAPAAAAGSTVWTLPSADGSSGQFLKTNGAGVLAWATASGGGITDLTGDVTASGAGSVAATVANVGGVTAANVAAGANLANAATAANTVGTIVKRDGSGNFVATDVTTSSLKADTLKLNNAGSIVNVVNPIGAAYTLTLPTGTGAAGQVLSTNGSGVTSWVTSSGTGDFLRDGSQTMTGALRATGGTAALPGYTFTGMTGTGMFQTGTNILGLSTAGTERVRIDATGAIGINNPFPYFSLDLIGDMRIVGSGNNTPLYIDGSNGSSGNIQTAMITSTAVDTGLHLNNGTAGGKDWTFFSSGTGSSYGVGNLNIGTNAGGLFTNRMTLKSAGQVGIGTTAPNAKLDVKGSIVMSGATSGYTGFAPAAAAGSTVWTLPAADGSTGQFLKTNGAGVLAWATASGGGITDLTGDVTASGAGSVAATVANVGGVTAANVAAGANLANAATAANTVSTIVKRDGSGNFAATDVTTSSIKADTLKLNNAGSIVNVVNPTGAAYTLTLPTGTGAAGQVLSTNGSGVTSWTAAGGTGDFMKDGSVAMTGALIALQNNGAAPMVQFGASNGGFGGRNGGQLDFYTPALTWAMVTNSFGSLTSGGALLNVAGSATNANFAFRSDSGTGMFRPAASTVAFTTGGAERLRIDSSGNVGIGTTSPTTKLDVSGSVLGGPAFSVSNTASAAGVIASAFMTPNLTAGYPTYLLEGVNYTPNNAISMNFNYVANGSSSNYGSLGMWGGPAIIAFNGSGLVGIGTTSPTQTLEVNGTVLASAYLYSSDRRLKKDITPLEKSLEKLLSLNTVKFNWIEPKNKDEERMQIGLIAQDVQKVFPEAVKEDSQGWLRMNYQALISPVIDGLRELYAKVLGLDARTKALELEVAQLKALNAQMKSDRVQLENRLDQIEKSLARQPAGSTKSGSPARK